MASAMDNTTLMRSSAAFGPAAEPMLVIPESMVMTCVSSKPTFIRNSLFVMCALKA